MKRITWILAVALVSVLGVGVQTSYTQAPAAPAAAPSGPTWAFAVPSPNQPPAEPTKEMTVPGSTKKETEAQVDDLFNTVDWFPDLNAPRPDIVMKGRKPDAMACGTCHLLSGMGHPESADLAGLPVQYIVNQMDDFKSGMRKDARMSGIAAATTSDEWMQAAQWFSNLKPIPWYKVEEADTVPKTLVTNARMRIPAPGGGTEPIGMRIIVVPQDTERVLARDPNAGFIAYVPKGSAAKGEMLVNTGGNGKTIACSICHGQGLKGLGDVPRLAGIHPTYLARQLYNFKSGGNASMSATLMKPVAANLTDEDIVDIAAYIVGLPQ
jgi:cytochrome c553